MMANSNFFYVYLHIHYIVNNRKNNFLIINVTHIIYNKLISKNRLETSKNEIVIF